MVPGMMERERLGSDAMRSDWLAESPLVSGRAPGKRLVERPLPRHHVRGWVTVWISHLRAWSPTRRAMAVDGAIEMTVR